MTGAAIRAGSVAGGLCVSTGGSGRSVGCAEGAPSVSTGGDEACALSATAPRCVIMVYKRVGANHAKAFFQAFIAIRSLIGDRAGTRITLVAIVPHRFALTVSTGIAVWTVPVQVYAAIENREHDAYNVADTVHMGAISMSAKTAVAHVFASMVVERLFVRSALDRTSARTAAVSVNACTVAVRQYVFTAVSGLSVRTAVAHRYVPMDVRNITAKNVVDRHFAPMVGDKVVAKTAMDQVFVSTVAVEVAAFYASAQKSVLTNSCTITALNAEARRYVCMEGEDENLEYAVFQTPLGENR